MKNGLGYVKEYYPNRNIKYEGNLENVKSSGYGTFFLINGDVYHGFWKT